MNILYKVNKSFVLLADYACRFTCLWANPSESDHHTSHKLLCGLVKQQSEVWREVAWGTSVQELRGGAWSLKSLDALNASVRQGWAGTIGPQLRIKLDKAWSVITDIHFGREGTMCSASVLHFTGRLTNTTLSTRTSTGFSDSGDSNFVHPYQHSWFSVLTSVRTYSLKRRLWILVIAFEAMGLPMPELAGEPWDTGVIL